MADSTDQKRRERESLKEALGRTGVTHAVVASALDVSRPTVTLWFKGEVSSPALDKAIPAYIAGLERGAQIAKAA